MGGLVFSNSPAVSWLWGNSPVDFRTPTLLDFPAFTVFATNYPACKPAGDLERPII
jgi:branched-chain amino acid transport system permease protein